MGERVSLESMSTLAEIEAALPRLTTPELIQIEHALHAIYRQRKNGLVYDDGYGALTETDLIASAEEAFLAYEMEEQSDGHRAPG